jgi:MFS superfamily sulfate permease-like transporter
MAQTITKNIIKNDLKASLVVFLVALPLCLGIAVASGAPPLAGLLAGIIGGAVIGILSGSHVSVSGPAAGLTVIVLDSIASLGSFDLFLGTVVIAGLIQIILGFAKAGVLGHYFPHSVIKGMLTAIGLILIIKQIPHGLGWDKEAMGPAYLESSSSFREIWFAFQNFSIGAIPITLISLLILYFFDRPKIKGHRLIGVIPGALWVVVLGVLINKFYQIFLPEWIQSGRLLVNIPIAENLSEMAGLLTFPDFSAINTTNFWIIAVTIAVIASIETLLSIEAGDKMDPEKRITPTSKELVAQGVGNSISGLIGGLPVTAVIVRTSANIEAGAKTKLSAIFHGVLIFILVLTIPEILNQIPLSCLAAILIVVGYKLAKPSVFIDEYLKGKSQFIPFIVTIIAILLTNLLVGIGIGLVVGFFFIIQANYHKTVTLSEDKGVYILKLQKQVSYLNKAPLMKALESIPDGSVVLINATKAKFIDQDIEEILNDFISSAARKSIEVKTKGFKYNLKEFH